MSTNDENLVKIVLRSAKIFGWICRFLPSCPKVAVVTLIISVIVITEHDVAVIFPLNIFESELLYSYLFLNASLSNDDHFVNFVQNLLPWQRPLMKRKKRSSLRPDRSATNKYLSLGEKS